MMLGGIFFPVGFFLLGWAPAAGKIVGLAFVGVAFLLIFQCVFSCRALAPVFLRLALTAL